MQPHSKPSVFSSSSFSSPTISSSSSTSASHAALWLVAALLWLGASSWLRPFAMPDEGRYVSVAWGMVQSGDWLVPRLNGLPYFHKPPLFYWLSAAGMWLFGLHEWAARLAPLAGAWLSCIALFLFVRRWSGQQGAERRALLVLATQPMLFGAAQYANLDMLVAGCIIASVLSGAHAVLAAQAGERARAALLGLWGFAALGVLAKGLIGVVLPALVLGGWLVVAWDWRAIARLFWWPAMLLFLLLAAPWFVAMQLRYAEFFDYFFVEQHWKRFTETGFNNPQPWWFFPGVLLVGILPWSLWLPRALRHAWRGGARPGSIGSLMWIWMIGITLFFSLPTSKLIGYVLPVLAPLAWLLATAPASNNTATSPAVAQRSSRWWRVSAGVAAALCLTLAIGSVWLQPRSSAAVGRAIAEARQPGEPVLYIDGNFFDVPLYARLTEPVRMVGHWRDRDWLRPDGWAREIGDTARFEPARTAELLIEPQQLVPALCAVPRAWLVSAPKSPKSYPFLDQAVLVVRTSHALLWRLDTDREPLRSVLRCGGAAPAQPAAAQAAP